MIKALQMITAVELIEKMIALLTPEKAWVKNTEAKDARGIKTCHRDLDAVCWCITGARRKLQFEHGLERTDEPSRIARTALIKAAQKYGCVSPAHYNDLKTTTHRKMLNFLHEARLIAPNLKPEDCPEI
jgi:hypothetical protein